MNPKSIKAAAGVYLVLAGVYVIYSMISQTGICGWLMEMQFNLLGSAYDKLTVLFAFMIVGVPGFWLISYAKSREHEIARADGTLYTPTAPQPVTMRKQLRTLIPLALAPALIAVPVYFYLTWQSRQDQAREVYKIDLNAGAAQLPADAKFIQFEGALQSAFEYGVTTGRSASDTSARSETYAPLTGENWDPSQPVRFVLYSSTYGGYAQFMPPGMRELPNGVIAGGYDTTLTKNELPTFVRNEYARQGLQLASPLYVVERSFFYDGRPPDAAAQGQYWIIPFLGIGLSLAIILGGGIGLAIRRARGADAA